MPICAQGFLLPLQGENFLQFAPKKEQDLYANRVLEFCGGDDLPAQGTSKYLQLFHLPAEASEAHQHVHTCLSL